MHIEKSITPTSLDPEPAVKRPLDFPLQDLSVPDSGIILAVAGIEEAGKVADYFDISCARLALLLV